MRIAAAKETSLSLSGFAAAIVAMVVVSGCSDASPQVAKPITTSGIEQSDRTITPDREKKLGPYVWVWVTVKVPAGQIETIVADCPTGDVVLGGGYDETDRDTLEYAKPNLKFDGWVVQGHGGPSTGSGNTVTAYASCAPVK